MCKLYEICNLVNLDVDTISGASSVNIGNTKHLGDTTDASSVGGSEVIGDFSNLFTAEQSYSFTCRTQDQKQKKKTPSTSSSRQVKKKIVNIVDGKKTKSYTAQKKST